jgi:DNA-binding Xre family transcriptional regulator
MARKAKSKRQKTGLYHAREARGMSRTELVKPSGISKQQLSRIENGLQVVARSLEALCQRGGLFA